MLRASFLLIFFAVFSLKNFAQNRLFAQKTIDTLASNSFYGRGYIKDGDKKAALYISEQYKLLGLKSLRSNGYFYKFSFPVNIFPGKCIVKIDGKTLEPGKDYLVNPGCPSIRKKLRISQVVNHINYPVKAKKIALLFDTSYKSDKKRTGPCQHI